MINVALITGGASGMGLAVATSLAQKGWAVSIADLNVEAGEKVAKEILGSFYRTDVRDFDSLTSTFDQVFKKHGQINFVFANAGVPERQNFYAKTDDISGFPAALDFVVDINLKSVISTSYLAQHYFRKSPKGNKSSLICTSSIAGLYPVKFNPMYTAAKHGVTGMVRSISKHFYEHDGIRVNAICPGNVRTNLFDKWEWDAFDVEWIEISQIVEVVEMLLFDESKHGQVVEVAPRKHYFVEQTKYLDQNAKRTLEGSVVDSIGNK
ncbi:hypothetical protein ACEPPN_003190 [Leptodophora sp. 'Broadleaf-Isolate-01']